MTSDQEIAAAANELSTVIAHKLDELANQLLHRPEVGSPEWFTRTAQAHHDHDSSHADEREWQLLKLRISKQAGIDPAPVVHCARALGASWHAIAKAYGITRQTAYHRWSQ